MESFLEQLSTGHEMGYHVFLFGLLTIGCLLVKVALERFSLPPIVGFLLLGIVLSSLNHRIPLVSESGETILSFLAALGVIVLLFRVGIESNLHALLAELPKASIIWLPNMAISGVPAYFFSRYLLGHEIIPSLFVAVALTATSVGVSVAVWEETGKMDTEEGELLLDTAELDDISGIALMALLFSIAPVLHDVVADPKRGHDSFSTLWQPLLTETGIFALKFALFIFAVLFIGKYLERPLAHSARKLGSKATVLIFVVGFGFLVAGSAGLLGLSLPVGALFAGLLLSRHRQDYGVQPFYRSIYLFFSPFFFIHIGFQIDPALALTSVGTGILLSGVAILGKLAGTASLAWLFTGAYGTMLLSTSMIPRAEITMVIIQRGREMGDWAMPGELYAAMVLVSGLTCLGTAVFLHWVLRRWKR